MKKVIIINGSPRKNFNTAKVLKEAQKGAEAAGAEIEYFNLVDLNFKGCMSCFACKRKGMDLGGLCAWRDELRPVLEKIVNADAVIMGSPVYDFYPTGMFRNLAERMLFAGGTYMLDENGHPMMNLKRNIPVGLIFTMNATTEQMKQYSMDNVLNANELGFKMVYGYAETLYVCDTYQFNDYSKYNCNMFDEAHKAEVRDNQFPKDLAKAYDLGKRLVEMNI